MLWRSLTNIIFILDHFITLFFFEEQLQICEMGQ